MAGIWGVYQLTVHQQRDISVLEKFIKLNEALSGEAASIIEGLPLTAENYTVAIKLLTKYYGSTEVIIQENFRYLHNLPIVPPGESRRLKTLGVPRVSYVIPFVSSMVDKLPKNVRTAWYRFIADKEETSEVKDFLAFLRKEVISQERSQVSYRIGQKRGATKESFDHLESKRARMLPSTSTLTTLTKLLSIVYLQLFCCSR